jgi:NAD(P)-dependent dehydrogenase (short-subunit alcohol dehydrogenase family)
MLDLSGKVAYVTGAGSGIGRGVALALAGAGADVAVSDISGERAGATAAMVRELGRRAVSSGTDVREYAALERDCTTAARELGGFHIAVANAGIARTGAVYEMSEEDWQTQIDVNLTGVFLTAKAASREMMRQGAGGRLILISSASGELPTASMGAYCSSKAGVRMLARCWAQELGPFGITVNSIGPGVIDTPLASVARGDLLSEQERTLAMGRVGQPGDIGNLACWLASDEAEYMTGQYCVMDGGWKDSPNWGAFLRHAEPQLQQNRDLRQRLSGDDLIAHIDEQAERRRGRGTEVRERRGLH